MHYILIRYVRKRVAISYSEWVCYKSRLLQDGQHGGLVPHGLLPGCNSPLQFRSLTDNYIPIFQRKAWLSFESQKEKREKVNDREK